jgi:hypothetical protein
MGSSPTRRLYDPCWWAVGLDAVIFNLLIGNNDAHAKNYSIYPGHGTCRLAPPYELVSTVYYPEIENKLAMNIGKQANPDLVTPTELLLYYDACHGSWSRGHLREVPCFCDAPSRGANRARIGKIKDLFGKLGEYGLARRSH